MLHSPKRILPVISQMRSLGSRTLADGSELIGHVPHIGPEAYFHVLFPPLKQSQIDHLEEELGIILPDALRQFYRYWNGIMLFAYSLSIDGMRRSYVRTGDEAWQPYSILTPNLQERPMDADDNLVFLGGYQRDGSTLAMRASSPEVFRCARFTARPLNRWPTFDEMLISEVERLSKLFDEKGRKIDPKAPTTPPDDPHLAEHIG